MTREAILANVAEITLLLKGPMPNTERALLVANRKELREQLKEMDVRA